MPDSLSGFGLQVFTSKLVIKFTKILATAPRAHSASLPAFAKPPHFLCRKHSLLRATVTRVDDTRQQRGVCNQHRHFRFALFPFSAANLDPAFTARVFPARSGAIRSRAHCSEAHSVLHHLPLLGNFSPKQSSGSK